MEKKIFVIGFNKTGTTSLNFLFKSLGINTTHTTKPVMEIINEHDAFTDGNHHDLNFINYYNAKPDSLFILNTRPIKKWLISRYKHASFTKFQKSWCWPVDEKTNVWIKLRETHFENVLTFFKDKPNQLLIINIEKDGWENVVSTFLQKNYRRVDNRRVEKSFRNIISADNIDVDKMKIINNNVTTCLQNNGYTGNELLLKNTDLSEYGYVTFL